MNWNAFDLIPLTFEKTKKRMLPFNFGEWLKLGFVSALGNSSGSSFNLKGVGNSGSGNLNSSTFDELKNNARDYISSHGFLIGTIVSLFLLFGLVFSYITSVFSFILIDLLVDKKNKFNFTKQASKGYSFFLFRFFWSIISFIVLGLLVSPYIYHFFNGDAIISSVGWPYIIFSIIFLILFICFMSILLIFANDLVLALMYSKDLTAFFSWKQIWKFVFANKKESFIYWLARLVVSICTGIIAVFAFIIAILIALLIGGILFLIGLLFYHIFGALILWIILGIVAALILFIVLIMAFLCMAAPLSAYLKYFQLLNFEKLTGIKILKI